MALVALNYVQSCIRRKSKTFLKSSLYFVENYIIIIAFGIAFFVIIASIVIVVSRMKLSIDDINEDDESYCSESVRSRNNSSVGDIYITTKHVKRDLERT